MRCQFNLFIRTATIAAWVLTGVDVLPDGWLWDLRPDLALFLIAAGCVGAYWWITRTHARPVDEVFSAGIAVGRREVELEMASDRVSRMSERRLTVVGD